jgi:4-amino-4-deoxy-L-arabinose transferase-like glycosyltransferase
VASAQKPPLYPLFLGVVSFFGGDSVTVHRLASGVAGVAAVLLIAYAAKLVAGPRAGLVAGAVAAVYPMFWVNDLLLQSESLYAAVAAVTIIVGYRFWKDPTLANAVVMGLAVGLAALTRAEAALLVPFMVVPLAWRAREQLRDRAVVLGAAAGAALLLVLPWVLWNLVRFEEPTFLSTGAGAVLNTASCDQTFYGEQMGYYGDCFRLASLPEATKREMCRRIELPDDCFTDPDQLRQVEASLQDRRIYDESEREQVARDQAVEYIGNHKSRLPLVMAARVGRMWDVFRPAQNVRFNWQLEARGERASQVGLLLYYALVPLAVVGGVALWRRRIPLSPLLAPMIVITITAALFFGTTRYRVPADVALVILAAVGSDALAGRLMARWRRG